MSGGTIEVAHGTDARTGDDHLPSAAVRIGTLLLDATRMDDDPRDLYRGVLDALNGDSRVAAAEGLASLPPPGVNTWPTFQLFRVALSDIEQPGHSPSPAKRFTVLLLGPLAFSVDVPVKNQRSIAGSPVPSEQYYAVWDGCTVVVGWANERAAHVDVPSGGHIAVEILRDAVRSCGFDVYEQACNPACEYELNHTTLLMDVRADVESGINFGRLCQRHNLHVEVNAFDDAEGDSLERHLRSLYSDLRSACREFAFMKNLANRAIVVSEEAAVTSMILLEMQRLRAAAAVGWPWSRTRKRLGMIGWRRHSRLKIAELWVQIAELDSLRREWHSRRDAFESEISQLGAGALFESDYIGEALDLERLDIAALQAKAQHAAERLDNRDVVVATGVGALAGGLAGAVIGLL